MVMKRLFGVLALAAAMAGCAATPPYESDSGYGPGYYAPRTGVGIGIGGGGFGGGSVGGGVGVGVGF
jgi:hypothetical protein